ncbi:glycosyltransferase family 2 protein [Nocardioides sp. LS1]|uniref:glycosyltransferase family 2 protein n=1 Tax=Nocardioides sp. LS1 TaxID=1027620 RepID=UPI000F622962|nr:glycosyltransferase family 2 protein [Nocardioides sp. LS1]
MRVDVLLPTYGSPALVREAVLSALAQDHADLRLVLVDDADPDPTTRDWAATLADDRVEVVRNTQNLGVNGNFRRCLELAEAPYLVVMGQDDVMLPGHLSGLVRLLEAHPEAVVAQPGVRAIDAEGRSVRPLADRVKARLGPRHVSLLAGEALAAGLLRGNWTYFPALGWRTEAVRRIGFRPGLEVVLDLALLLDVAREGGGLAFDPAVTFAYRRHAASVSSDAALDGRRFVEERAFFAAEAVAFRTQGWGHAARAARVHLTSRLHAASLLPRAARAGDWTTARTLARHTLA